MGCSAAQVVAGLEAFTGTHRRFEFRGEEGGVRVFDDYAQVFTKDEVGVLRAKLDGGPWADGNMTSGHQAATAKRNLQLPEECDVAREVSALVVQALNAKPMFVAAALPLSCWWITARASDS